jgi:FdhE protein
MRRRHREAASRRIHDRRADQGAGVRQGETAKGAWVGTPTGGVPVPQALFLPDPATVFSRRAARLDALAPRHKMADWLRFMARLARAQHEVATALGATTPGATRLAAIMPGKIEGGPDTQDVEQAVAARMPPLAADGHRRSAGWRDGLAMLLDAIDSPANPAPAQAAIDLLRCRDAAAVERLADGFLLGGIDREEAGTVLYVAAALQVWFTMLASDLPETSLRLLPQRGLCPCCGSTPVAGVVTGAGSNPGTRYLHCSLCATSWTHVRAVCISCGQSRRVSQRAIEGGSEAVKAETCDDCRSYTKMLYQAKDMQVDPFADDLASLGLDIMVAEAGWSRHAPNPLLLSF